MAGFYVSHVGTVLRYFKLGWNDSSWGVLVRLAFGDPISESQATDRSTFCPMPGGWSQAASDAPH
jgi:hypothetical protein